MAIDLCLSPTSVGGGAGGLVCVLGLNQLFGKEFSVLNFDYQVLFLS